MNLISFSLVPSLFILALILVFWVFNFIVIYHLIRFGIGTQPKRIAVVFLLGSSVLFLMSAQLYSNIDKDDLRQRYEKVGNGIFPTPNTK